MKKWNKRAKYTYEVDEKLKIKSYSLKCLWHNDLEGIFIMKYIWTYKLLVALISNDN